MATEQAPILTSEECLLNPNRNPQLGRADIEQYRNYCAARKVIWLGRGTSWRRTSATRTCNYLSTCQARNSRRLRRPVDAAAVLIPAFMISELKRAFEIGFLLFLPFLIIDLVVASVLMSMGMMMLPPVVVSLPFKLIFFVLVDGWTLVAGSLIQSYGT